MCIRKIKLKETIISFILTKRSLQALYNTLN